MLIFLEKIYFNWCGYLLVDNLWMWKIMDIGSGEIIFLFMRIVKCKMINGRWLKLFMEIVW